MIQRLTLLGATGDLAGRFLFPALAHLIAEEKLGPNLSVVGAARDDLGAATFRRLVEERLDRHATGLPARARESLLGSVSYKAVDLSDPASVAAVLDHDDGSSKGGSVAVYLALPASLFQTTLESLRAIGLPHGSRIAIEKPFGRDLASARSLNQLLLEAAGEGGEEAIFRVDHVLGMATTQNLMHLRLANPLIESVWNSEHIEEVDIMWEETLGLEGRAGFYDETGALKDVMQNHVLQLLSLVAMEPPAEWGERALRDAKVQALRSVRDLADDQVASRTRRARYTAGHLADTGGAGGGQVPAYAEEDGVDPARGTETFAEISLEIDNERWSGTRFLLRAGKALAQRRKGLLIHFRTSSLPDGAASHRSSNELWIGIDGPQDISLQLNGPAAESPIVLSGDAPTSPVPPYGHVLENILRGDGTLSVRGDEAEEAWRVVTPVLKGWAEGRVPLEGYPAGSNGP